MMQLKKHSRQVELWVDQKLQGRSHEDVIDEFNRAFQRVWDKSELTLGRVTMQAIADRIVHIGRGDYPWLGPILNRNDGIDVSGLVHNAKHIPGDELRQGLSFLLSEFLRVLGHLTAEIISSKLYTALMEDSSSVKGGKG